MSKKPVPIVDTYGIYKAVQRVADVNGLQLKIDYECQVPYTDMGTKEVVVPALSAYSTPNEVTSWRAIAYHECGHHSPEVIDIYDLMKDKGINMSSTFGKVLNIVEDIRNEKNRLGDYPGRDLALSEGNEIVCKQIIEKFEKGGTIDPALQDLFDAQVMSMLERSDWQPHVATVASKLEKYASPKIEKLKGLIPEVKAMVTAEDVYNVTRKIIEDLGMDPEEEEEKAREGSGEGEEGKEEESEGDGKDDGDISYEDILMHPHTGKKHDKPSGGSIKYDHEWGRSEFKPWTYRSEIVEKPASTVKGDIQEAYDKGSKLSHKAKKLFQSESQTRRTYYKKSGRLSAKDLYRIPNGDIDVFWKNENRISVEGTAIFLLTDASGSMRHGKFEVTAAATALMADALLPLKPALKIATFTEGSEIKGVEHHMMKNWTEKCTPETILKRYSNYYSRCIQNSDGESVLWAASELYARPEKRKILIVMSDGLPETDAPGDAAYFTKCAVAEVSKRIECYGLGIMDDSVRQFYPEYTVVKKLDQLEEKLLEVIKSKMLRR